MADEAVDVKQDKDEFDSVFAEISGTDTPPEGEAQPKKEEEPKPEAKPEGEAKGGGEEPKPDKKDEPKPESKSEEGDEDDAEKWKARYKTLEGKYRKEVVEEREARKKAETPPQKEEEPKKAEANPEEEELLKELESDLPTVSKAVRLLIDRERKKLEEEFNSRLKPVESRQVESAQERHFSQIRGAHSDFDSIVAGNELFAFVESQPSYMKAAMERVLEAGSAKEVIELLTDFKERTGKNKKEAQPAGEADEKGKKTAAEIRREKAKENAEDVKVRGAVQIPAGKPDPNDFDAAFEEAISKSKAA